MADYTNALIERVRGDIAQSTRRRKQLAMLVSSVGGGSGNPAPSPNDSGEAPVGRVSGNVDNWIAQAYKALGIKLTPSLLKAERLLIQRESGGNPNAINKWDSNWRKGTPSKGLAQTIDPTFRAHALRGFQGARPGSGDIYDPVENLVASLRYRQSRYGSYITPGMRSALSGGSYRGY